MVRAASSAAFAAVSAAITAIQLYYSLDLQPEAGTSTTTTTTTASAPVADFQKIFLTLIPAAALYAAAGLLYRRLRQAEVGGAAAGAGAGAGGGDRRPSDLVAFMSAAAGVLEFFLFAGDVGAVGLAAARVIPAASIATFFLGIVLIILAHIRAGGEGGDGGAVAGDGAIQAPVWLVFVTKMAFAAAAGLVALIVIALYAN